MLIASEWVSGGRGVYPVNNCGQEDEAEEMEKQKLRPDKNGRYNKDACKTVQVWSIPLKTKANARK